MLSGLRDRLTYSNVVATLALFVALGGSSYAALSLPRNSVGTEQVKPGSLRLSDLQKSAKSQLRGKRGPRGAVGPRGATGPRGARGATGLRGATGTAGTARAYATVVANSGQAPLFTAMVPSLAFGTVLRTATGTYCLVAPILTPAQRSAAVVSVREVGPYLASTGICGDGIEVQTRDAAGTPVDSVDFNVWVP